MAVNLTVMIMASVMAFMSIQDAVCECTSKFVGCLVYLVGNVMVAVAVRTLTPGARPTLQGIFIVT